MPKQENSTTKLPADFLDTYAWLDRHLLAHEGTTREYQPAWQAHKYLHRGKMFAYIGWQDKTNHPILTLKLEPSFSEMLRDQYPDITPGYYMNKLHWSSIYLDSAIPIDTIKNIVDESHDLAKGKK